MKTRDKIENELCYLNLRSKGDGVYSVEQCSQEVYVLYLSGKKLLAGTGNFVLQSIKDLIDEQS